MQLALWLPTPSCFSALLECLSASYVGVTHASSLQCLLEARSWCSVHCSVFLLALLVQECKY
jgi:hypothetical protein